MLNETDKEKVIANVLRAFLLKMNVPVPDTEKLADKVREKKMGELFADMEKMDIQAEWKKTAKAVRRAEHAEKLAEEAQRQVLEVQKQFQEMLGATKASAIENLMEQKQLSLEAAREKTALYWKE